MEGAFPVCVNWDCSRRVYGRLQKFVNVLDFKGAGEETLRQLVEKGILKTAPDLFTLTQAQFEQVERKGEKAYRKYQEGLEIVREMSAAQFFASLDVEGILTWETIATFPTLNTVEKILHLATQAPAREALQAFTQVPRVSTEKATDIIKEIRRRLPEIKALYAHARIKTAGDKLIGKVFCITGSLSEPRPKIEKRVKDLGGRIASSVSKNVHYLVTNEPDPSSEKGRKAAALGIPVISEAALREMF